MTRSLEEYEELVDCLVSIRECSEKCSSFDSLLEQLNRRGYTQERLSHIIRPRVTADLHVHSNHSDGNMTPRRLVWLARVMGLRALAICDHDNVSGVEEAVREGNRVGLKVIPGVEFQTGKPGLEILCYFPDSDASLRWLSKQESSNLREYLATVQSMTHRSTLEALVAVNAFLQEQGVSSHDLITYEELSKWYQGQEPFYPGTLAVVGLKRLTDRDRDRLGIHDPREFNTKVVTPALKGAAVQSRNTHSTAFEISVEKVFDLIRSVRAHEIRTVSVLAHPKELVTKGGLRYGQVRDLIRDLVADFQLDGLEVNNSRDDPEDTARWLRFAADVEREIEDTTGRDCRLIRFSLSSDFHVLNPGLASGEITMGYGMLDERDSHRAGNLSPVSSFDELWLQIQSVGRRSD